MRSFQQLSVLGLALGCVGAVVAIFAGQAEATPQEPHGAAPVLIAVSVGNSVRMLSDADGEATGEAAQVPVRSARTLACLHLMQTTLVSLGLNCRETAGR